jgi:hypothetical protein
LLNRMKLRCFLVRLTGAVSLLFDRWDICKPKVCFLFRLKHAFCDSRNSKHAKADWQFTTADARIKLKRLYPAL